MIDLYDSDVIKIQKILDTLNDLRATKHEYEAFDRQIKQRFSEIGFVVTVNWYTLANPDGTPVPDLYMPEITIDGRIAPDGTLAATGAFEFDHDQQVHEVTNDLLGIGEGGVIKTGDINPEHRAILDAHRHHHD